MVIGCKLCEGPLVNKPIVENWKLRMKLREEAIERAQQQLLEPTSGSNGGGSEQSPLIQGRLEGQILAAKCGHCFHKGCLKKLLASSHNGVAECPCCSKPIHFAHTWPILIHLGPTDEFQFDSAEKICEENEILRDQIFEIKKRIEEKEDEMKNVYHKISESRFELTEKVKKQTEEISAEGAKCKEMEEERKKLEQVIMNLNRENTKILKMIAELAENDASGSVGKRILARNECLSNVKWPLNSKMSNSSLNSGVLFKPRMFGEEFQVNLLREKEELIAQLNNSSDLKRRRKKEELLQKKERQNFEELASKIDKLEFPQTLAKKKILTAIVESGEEADCESDLQFVHYRCSPRSEKSKNNTGRKNRK